MAGCMPLSWRPWKKSRVIKDKTRACSRWSVFSHFLIFDMCRSDRIALLFSLVAVLLSSLVTEKVFENMPHLEDEIAYAWQAQVIAHGQLSIASPKDAHSFFVPFVVDYQGRRFSKYPLGWPILLAVGVGLGVRGLVNPLLAGLGVWLIYLLGRRLAGPFASLLAAGLTLTSPFFLLNSGSLLSHPLGLVLSAALGLVWLDGFADAKAPRRWLPTLTAAGLVGALVITRPLTAIGVTLPFILYGLALFIKGNRQTRLHLAVLGLLSIALCGLHFAWQYALTGDALLDPYTLVWPYDRVGFGPGFGVLPEGHTLLQGLLDTSHSLQTGWRDLFGWAGVSWILLPFGVWALRHNRQALLVGSVFPCLVIVYLAYWVGADLFGPRYYYEGLYSLTIFSGAGAAWIMGKWREARGKGIRDAVIWGRFASGFALDFKKVTSHVNLPSGLRRAASDPGLRLRLGAGALALLVLYNLVFYLPGRLQGMVGLNGMSQAAMQPFRRPEMQALAPALVIVTPKTWTGYGTLLELEDPWLTTPLIFALTRGPAADAKLAQDYSGRVVIPYTPR
jgi:hypothetical protein